MTGGSRSSPRTTQMRDSLRRTRLWKTASACGSAAASSRCVRPSAWKARITGEGSAVNASGKDSRCDIRESFTEKHKRRYERNPGRLPKKSLEAVRRKRATQERRVACCGRSRPYRRSVGRDGAQEVRRLGLARERHRGARGL